MALQYNVPFDVSFPQYLAVMAKFPGAVAGQDSECGLPSGRYRLKVLVTKHAWDIERKLEEIQREMNYLKK